MGTVDTKAEFGAGEDWFANASRSHLLAEPCRAFFEAKHLRYSQQNSGVARGFDHLPALIGVDGHWLFAQNWLAASGRD